MSDSKKMFHVIGPDGQPMETNDNPMSAKAEKMIMDLADKATPAELSFAQYLAHFRIMIADGQMSPVCQAVLGTDIGDLANILQFEIAKIEPLAQVYAAAHQLSNGEAPLQ